MTQQLILIRHAKSSWKHRELGDHDRPLNGRGRKSAKAIGAWMRTQNLAPDHAMISTATRAQETFSGLGVDLMPKMSRALYLADARSLLREIRTATGTSLLVIAHNPGIAELAERLIKDIPKHRRFLDYPTAATTVIEFDVGSWAEITFGGGTARHFVIPRELLQK